MLPKFVVILAAFVLRVNCQTPPISSIPPCVLDCTIAAAAQNNCALTDVACICNSAQLQADTRGCLEAHCTAADIQAALQLQSGQCLAASISIPPTASTTRSVPFTFSLPSTSGGAASTPTAPASASATSAPTGSSAAASPSATKTSAAPSAHLNGRSLAVVLGGVVVAITLVQ